MIEPHCDYLTQNLFNVSPDGYLGAPMLFLSAHRGDLESIISGDQQVFALSLERTLNILNPLELFYEKPSNLSEKGKQLKAALDKGLRGEYFDVWESLSDLFYYRGPLTCRDKAVDTLILKVLKSLGVEGWLESLPSERDHQVIVIFDPRVIQEIMGSLHGLYETDQ